MTKLALAWHTAYQSLPDYFYRHTSPSPVQEPEIILYNQALAQDLGMPVDPSLMVDYLSGNKVDDPMSTIAQAYGGHQFGHFNILGDGRAILLGQFYSPSNTLWSLQLKGAGPTPYSRRGDGRGALSSMLREYLIGEAMHALNIPTTRNLAVVSSGQTIRRQEYLPGGILTRLSESYVRVGTFQYASTQGPQAVKALADYMIQNYFNDVLDQADPYLALFEAILDRQARLIALWQSIGFIHGVMNTDNTSILGETIDYGPCAFIDTYNPKTVYSEIDTRGRYAFGNQANMALWNLSRLAEVMHVLFKDQDLEVTRQALGRFKPLYNGYYHKKMAQKLGLDRQAHQDQQIIHGLLAIMYEEKLDYTRTFTALSYDLSSLPESLNTWLSTWQRRLFEDKTLDQAQESMQAHNPWVIPRNHLVEKALRHSDLSFYKAFYKSLMDPYDYSKIDLRFYQPPRPHERIISTHCNT